MRSDHFGTIAAISTPPGKGGVAVIRVSGPEAFAIGDLVFRPRGVRRPQDAPRTAVYGDMLSGGQVIDDGLATAFPAPASYTGEDTLELSCHGGVLITHTLLSALFAAGAVPAAPGEFTRRAFLSGRLGLTEAEAIADLLDAKSEAQVRLSVGRGHLAARLSELRGVLMTLVSSAEAVIDFPEEDLAELSEDELYERLHALREATARLCETYRTGRAVSEGLSTVIVGRPNVGKSSLYNLLVGEDAAIVTEHAGTTRDVLERTVPLGQVLLRLADTAGLRVTDDPVERIGVTRAEAALSEAELILAVFDGSAPLTDDDRALLARLRELSATRIALVNKSDLPCALSPEALGEGFAAILPISAKGGDPLPLQKTVEGLFTDGTLVLGEDAILSSARQHATLCRTRDALIRAEEALAAGAPADMYLYDLTEALAALGETDGRTVNEEIVAEIFGRFCVGK